MTNIEFQKKLDEMYQSHVITRNKKKKTFNELVWVLRQDNVDYNISIPPYYDGMGWLCISSVKECFIPVSYLAKHVSRVELEEDDFECDEICLTVHLED
jgi:hypothetical protein